MIRRRGVLSAGTFCVDFNKSIARWTVEDTSSEIVSLEQQGGGSGYNMAIDLKRLDPDMPVEAMGVVGDDDFARYLFAELDSRGISRDGLLSVPGRATMSVDAFNNLENGRRTHFFHQGVARVMNPDHFDFTYTTMGWLHLGLPGAHETMDAPWGGEPNGWVATLRKARMAGLKTNLELMTTSAARIAALGRPCLPYLDTLIVNDFEIGALTGRPTRREDGSTDIEAVSAAIGAALNEGAMDWAVVHFPEGGVAGGRDGTRLVMGSVLMPPDAVAGVNGAGDAFSAGMLYGLERDWPIGDGLRLAHATAAASMRKVSTTEGVGTVAECLALTERYGFRPTTLS